MKLKFLILALTFYSASLFAQDEFPGGSPYTVFGIGDLQYNTSLRTESMGILGIALPGNYINSLNPASNNKLPYTTFSLQGTYHFLKSSDGVKELKTSDGNVSGINIGIPFNKNNGWVLNLGFNPLSNVDYKITNSGTQQEEAYTRTYSGQGGLSRFSAGMTYILFKSLSFGAEYNYTFGNIINQAQTDFSSATITDTYIRKENDFIGSYFKGGLRLDFDKLTKNKNLRNISIGVFYASPISLTTTTDAIYKNSLNTDTVTLSEGTMEIPQILGFGISNTLGRVTVSADFLMQDYTQFKENGVTSPAFQNSMRYGLGVEIQPSAKTEKNFWQKLTYRAGAYYSKDYFTVNGEDLNTIGFGLGLGVPLGDFNSFDIAATYKMRGKETNGLVKDQIVNLSLGFNFGELWFIRPNDE